MSFHKYFNKWWLMLSYGLLLILLSYFVFSNSSEQLSSAVNVFGFIALLTGAILGIGFFFTGKEDRHEMELFFSMYNAVAGIVVLSGVKALDAWLFVGFMVINAIVLIKTAWHLKSDINWSRLMLLHFFYSLVIGFLMLMGKNPLQLPMTVLIGIQVLNNGLLLVVFAMVLRKEQLEFVKTIHQIKDEASE